MRILLIMLSLLSSLGILAQDFRSTGEFKSDVKGVVAHNAWLELSLSQNYESLRLLILPTRDADVSVALVDTVWTRGAAYRNGESVFAEKYEERDIYFLYDLDSDGHLTGYYVFSRFIDTTQKDVQQIAVRKFDAEGNRLWCMTMNTNNDRSKEFFNILKEARKKMNFKKTTSVRDNTNNPQFQDYRISKPTNTIGRGSAYGTGW